jgi:DNA modification methylase
VILYLGDCREILGTAFQIDAFVTDPPYGIDAKLGMGGGTKGDGGMWKGRRIEGDQDTQVRDDVLQGGKVPFAAFGKVNIAPPPGTRATVVWDKGEHVGAGDLSLPWKPNFELVFIGGKGWSYPRRGSGIVKVNAVAGCVGNRNDGHRHHPFEKPVQIMRHFIERAPGVSICDPFMGSGTTGVAAVNLGRRFVGIEIDPEFFDIACRRLADALKRPELLMKEASA